MFHVFTPNRRLPFISSVRLWTNCRIWRNNDYAEIFYFHNCGRKQLEPVPIHSQCQIRSSAYYCYAAKGVDTIYSECTVSSTLISFRSDLTQENMTVSRSERPKILNFPIKHQHGCPRHIRTRSRSKYGNVHFYYAV